MKPFKLIFASLIFAVSSAASADHLDVIEFKFNEGCGLDKFLEIVSDFNAQWGDANHYKAEVLAPIQSHNLESMYWIGRSADAAAFGKAWDTWRDELQDSNSTAARLWARLEECTTNLGRRSYDIY